MATPSSRARRRGSASPAAVASPAAAERTPTIADIMAVSQLAMVPLLVEGWRWPNGDPFRLTIRALTFRERSEAYRAALKAGIEAKLGTIDDDTWAIEVALRGIVEPRFTRGQLDVLLDSNAAVIDAIVDAIDRAGQLPAQMVEHELKRMAQVADPADSST